jgi:mono/diheme cytochrome c family protein
MAQRDPNKENEQVHFGQIFFDDMFLLLVLGVAAPFMIYTVWGLMDTGSIPQLPPSQYAVAAIPTESTDRVSLGEQLAQQLGCHSTDGSQRAGPTWKGLYGSSVLLTNATTVTADDAYLKESILNANAQVVQGFNANVMPSYRERISPTELDALVAYIQSLK